MQACLGPLSDRWAEEISVGLDNLDCLPLKVQFSLVLLSLRILSTSLHVRGSLVTGMDTCLSHSVEGEFLDKALE